MLPGIINQLFAGAENFGKTYKLPPVPTQAVAAGAGTNGTAAPSVFTTASFTPAANSTLIAFGAARHATAGPIAAGTISDSGGGTWTKLGTANMGTGVNATAADVWIQRVGASPAARTVTFTYANAGGTQFACGSVMQFASADIEVLGVVTATDAAGDGVLDSSALPRAGVLDLLFHATSASASGFPATETILTNITTTAPCRLTSLYGGNNSKGADLPPRLVTLTSTGVNQILFRLVLSNGHVDKSSDKRFEVVDLLDEGWKALTTASETISINMGAPAADRMIVIPFGGRFQSVRLLNSVTINGVAATVEAYGVANAVTWGIAYAMVPTGTTGDVVFQLNGNPNGRTFMGAVYRLTGLDVFDYHRAQDSNDGSAAQSLTIPAIEVLGDGIGIWGIFLQALATNVAFAFPIDADPAGYFIHTDTGLAGDTGMAFATGTREADSVDENDTATITWTTSTARYGWGMSFY